MQIIFYIFLNIRMIAARHSTQLVIVINSLNI